MDAVLPDDLIARIKELAAGKDRVIVAIAGPPGAGKSTITEALAATLPEAAVLPMDGFHLDNDVLSERGHLHRKGAPHTFDVDALHALLIRLRGGEAVSVPTFDREADRVVPDGGWISAEAPVVLVEGNYLLLDAPGWRDLGQFWDLTISLEVAPDVLEQRLMQRWLDHGFTEAEARTKVHANDMLNAKTVLDQSHPADIVVRH